MGRHAAHVPPGCRHAAEQHCDLYISTDGLLPEDVEAKTIAFLRTSKKET